MTVIAEGKAGRLRRVAGLAVALVLAVHLSLAVSGLAPGVVLRISTAIYIASVLVTAALTLLARSGLHGRELRIWTYLSLSFVGFTLAAVYRAFMVYSHGHTASAGSPEDIGLAIGFLFLVPVVASLGNPVHASRLMRAASAVDLASVCLLALLILYMGMLVPTGAVDVEHSFMRDALLAGYAILGTAFAAYPLLYRRDPWTPRAALTVAAIGSGTTGVVAMLGTVELGTYFDGSPVAVVVDTLIIAAYLLLGLAAVWRLTAGAESARTPRAAEDTAGVVPAIVAAISAVVIPFVLLSALGSPDPIYARVLVGVTSGLVALLVVRSALTLIENRRLGDVKASAARYRSVVDNSPSSIFVMDREGRIVYANESVARLLEAASPYDLIGRRLLDIMPPDSGGLDAYVEVVSRLQRAKPGQEWTGQIAPPATTNVHTLRGREIVVERTVSAIVYDGDPALLVQGVDVTARVAAERRAATSAKRLEELAAEASRVADRERAWLAQSLKERVQPDLVAVRQRLLDGQMHGLLVGPLVETLPIIDRGIARTQSLMSDLSPHALGGLSLTGALIALCEEHRATSGLECTVQGDLEGVRISEPAWAALYRSAREALRNVSEHAHASVARVRCVVEPGSVSVTVTDGGVGFDADKTLDDASLAPGLLVMRGRLENVGGWLSVTSRPGHGTSVTLTVPREPD